MRAYGHFVSIRRLFAIVVALSVLFAPAAALAGEMHGPTHDGMRMMSVGHCQMPPSNSSDHDKMAGKNCCISMCMAVAIQPSVPQIDKFSEQAPALFAIPAFQIGGPGELATPPPKLS